MKTKMKWLAAGLILVAWSQSGLATSDPVIDLLSKDSLNPSAPASQASQVYHEVLAKEVALLQQLKSKAYFILI